MSTRRDIKTRARRIGRFGSLPWHWLSWSERLARLTGISKLVDWYYRRATKADLALAEELDLTGRPLCPELPKLTPAAR
jgi:hypothetical protein